MKILVNTPSLKLMGGVANHYKGLRAFWTENVRESGNQFYLLRETVAIFGVMAAIYILYKKQGKNF